MICLGLLSVIITIPQANAAQVPVTLTITRVYENSSPDLDGSPGDYYPIVSVGTCNFNLDGQDIESVDFSPFWQFTCSVDANAGPVPISIHLADSDFGPDDNIDINPTAGQTDLSLQFDLSTNTWTGDVPPNVGFSAGVNDGDGAARILFVISSTNGDIDGDGIPDGVEFYGIRDSNGNVIQNTNGFGFPMDPCRKTVAVEIDYMNVPGPGGHSHQPLAASMTEAVSIFNNAPAVDTPAVSNCPYPGFPTQSSGINLVVDVDDAVTEATTTSDAQFTFIKAFGLNPARVPYFHYNLWGHDQPAPNIGTSGIVEGTHDFLVSLGNGWTGTNGNQAQQVGTFMHELGHTLGLGHGGGDLINCKPNYFSAMNYDFQFGVPTRIPVPGGGTGIQNFIDYSRITLPPLNEPGLNENVGIGAAGTDYQNAVVTWDINGNSTPFSILASANGGKIDWNQNGPAGTYESNVAVDLNNFLNARNDDCPAKASTVRTAAQLNSNENLVGYDDWANLKYKVEALPASGSGPAPDHHPDMTSQDYQAFQTNLQQSMQEGLKTDLKVTKTVDKLNAIPGDTLTYTVKGENIGKGPATGVQLVDAFPSGPSETRDLDDIEAGQSNTQTLTYKVSFPIADGAVLTNTATITDHDTLGNPDIDTINNVATATTTVHTPVLKISKTATSSVNSGEPITYRITYQNTGSLAATGVVITDRLPADVYYSIALDTGAGPKPNSVVHNPDGSTTLTWNIGNVAAASASSTIEYKARPSLLFVAGNTITNGASLDFTDANGNDYPAISTSSTTSIKSVTATKDPLSQGYWKNHPELWSAETRARIQATDHRFDGADGTTPDGQLSSAEVKVVLNAGGNQLKILKSQLLATYFNLATRHINADTPINSVTAKGLGLGKVKDAVLYAENTLSLPANSANSARYDKITKVLDEINQNKSEVYK